MNPIYAASIAEVHEDGDLYSSLFTGDEKTVIKSVNGFFEEEKAEGHDALPEPFTSLAEIDGCDIQDRYGDRRYRLTVLRIAFRPVHAAYIVNDQVAIRKYMEIRDAEDKDLTLMDDLADSASFEDRTFNTIDEQHEFEKGIEAAGGDWCYVKEEDIIYFTELFN